MEVNTLSRFTGCSYRCIGTVCERAGSGSAALTWDQEMKMKRLQPLLFNLCSNF